MPTRRNSSDSPTPEERAAQRLIAIGGVVTEKNYGYYRWLHWWIFLGIVVTCALLDDSGQIRELTYTPVVIGGVLSLFVEICYLCLARWQVSLAYLLLAVTYLAVTAGAAVTALKVGRYLFG